MQRLPRGWPCREKRDGHVTREPFGRFACFGNVHVFLPGASEALGSPKCF